MQKNALLGGILLLVTSVLYAQQTEEFATSHQPGVDQPTVIRGPVISPDNIFAGTSLNGPGGNNDVHLIDPITNTATAFLAGVPVWGAAYDIANARILYTTEGGNFTAVDGAALFEIPINTGVPAFVGVVRDVTGADYRIDGLAFSGGTLYGSRAAADNDGIYTIDMTTFTATLVVPLTDSVSGIDADPVTGTIYGVNDTAGQLISIDVIGGTTTNIAAYPDPAEDDIDGLAVGGGRAFLIPDDDVPGLIYVYDLTTNSYLANLTAPWGAVADTFSGGAYISGSTLPAPVEVPTLSVNGLLLFVFLLFVIAAFSIKRSGSKFEA